MAASAVRSSSPVSLTLASIAFALGAAWPGAASAVVTATGANGSTPTPALNLDGVGQLSNGCSSVLLAGGNWVLASAHCAGTAGGTVSFGNGTVATIAETVTAAGYAGQVGINDLSLMRLDVPVSVAGYALQAASVDGRTVLIAGYGAGGSGDTGASLPGGTLRYGYNQYELVLPDEDGATYAGRLVGYDFDDGSTALNRFGSSGLGRDEASVAGGDSGGASFSFVDGAWGVAGIHVGYDDSLGFGYGGVGVDILLGDYLPWISQVTSVPEPSAAWLMLGGLAGLGACITVSRRRRRRG